MSEVANDRIPPGDWRLPAILAETAVQLNITPRPARVASQTSKAGRQYLDLTGQKFTRLTALRPTWTYAESLRWVCKCDCGRISYVRPQDLRSKRARSCGCLVKEERRRRLRPIQTAKRDPLEVGGLRSLRGRP